MMLGNRLLADGPIATNWAPWYYQPGNWTATSVFNGATTMATYQPTAIPAQAKFNGGKGVWTIDPEVEKQLIYKLVIDSPTLGTLSPPMQNFQGYIKADGASFAAANIPDVLRWIDQIEPLLVDAGMTIYRGYRFADGTEQLEAIAWGDFPLELRSDQGANNSTIRLSGYRTLTVGAGVVRPLTGPQYRNTIDGRRRYRCDMDAFLRPGDIADINGETFPVEDINYIVGDGRETMEIVENNAA